MPVVKVQVPCHGDEKVSCGCALGGIGPNGFDKEIGKESDELLLW
jgi:hypothetical protein